jgi:hypothetical protein
MPSVSNLVTLDKRCIFDLGNGVTCGSSVHCRGYCEKHYAQLRRAGAFASLTHKPASDKAIVLHNVASVRKARKKLLKAMPDLMDDFVRGAQVAANTGKTDAIQWAILHTHTLAPVAATSDKASANGVVVNIGVKVSGTATE